MEIRKAESNDCCLISEYDEHIKSEELLNSINLGRVYIAQADGEFVGWLRYNLFWDNTPFMNMLFVLDQYREKGVGKALVYRWEEDMQEEGYTLLMTSTASDEFAQHFYNKLGYKAVGGFAYGNDPYEIIMTKQLERKYE